MDCDLAVLEVLRDVRPHSYIESPTLTGLRCAPHSRPA